MTLTKPMLTEPSPSPNLYAEADAADLQKYAGTRDAEAFTRVVQRHIDMVYSLCRRELRNAELAEDAAQAVFILLAAKAGTFRENRRITGWLYETARNCCRNARRAQIRRTRHESAAAMERSEMNNASPAVTLESEELAQTVHRALARLPRHERDLLLMRYFQKLSTSRIAQLLSISDEAAKQRAARALRKLRALVHQSDDAENWLERGALMIAPSHMAAHAANAATGGAGGAPAAIAKAVTTAARAKFAGLIFVGVAVGVGAIGGVVHIASAPSAQAPITQAPITPPATATPAPAVLTTPAPPAAAADEAKERSTPLDCLHAISAREKSLDATGLLACLHDDGSDMGNIIKHSIRVDIAQIRLSNAAKATFGPDGDVFHQISSPTTSAVIDLLLATAPSEIQMNGDTATMPLRLPPVLLNMGLKDWQGLTLRFVRSPSDGGWKIDLTSTLMYVSYIPGKGSQRTDAASTIAFLDTVADVADRVSGEISRREIASPELIGGRFNLLMNQERTAKHIQIIGGRTVPRPNTPKTP